MVQQRREKIIKRHWDESKRKGKGDILGERKINFWKIKKDRKKGNENEDGLKGKMASFFSTWSMQ
jgi:hypothetical protein